MRLFHDAWILTPSSGDAISVAGLRFRQGGYYLPRKLDRGFVRSDVRSSVPQALPVIFSLYRQSQWHSAAVRDRWFVP